MKLDKSGIGLSFIPLPFAPATIGMKLNQKLDATTFAINVSVDPQVITPRTSPELYPLCSDYGKKVKQHWDGVVKGLISNALGETRRTHLNIGYWGAPVTLIKTAASKPNSGVGQVVSALLLDGVPTMSASLLNKTLSWPSQLMTESELKKLQKKQPK